MDDFSIESLYEMGLGLKARENTSKVSIEGWDGDSDSLAYEMASAESMIDTMDVYSRITALNASQQIKCAHRISANYGNCNRGIESFCNNVILSAESDAASAGADTKSDDKDAAKDEKNDEKKEAWYKKWFSVIKQFFKKIWQFICSIPRRIKAFVKHIFGKKENSSSSSNATSNSNDSSSNATSNSNDSSSSSSSSNNKQNQAALPEKTGKLSDKELATYNKSSPSSQTSQFVKSSANGQLKTSNGNQVQNKNSSSSTSNKSNTNSKLSEITLNFKKHFEKFMNTTSENIDDAIKDIEGSHNKLVSIIEKIEKSKTQDKKALSIFSNCCKIVSEYYKIFVKGSHIFSSFCTDFLNNINNETLKDKSKMKSFDFGGTMDAKRHGKYLKIIIVQTCMIGENIKFSEYGNNNIKKEVYNGSAAVNVNDYNFRPIMNSASSFVKAVANYAQLFFNYNFTEAKDLNNEMLRTNPDGFFRKLLSSIQKSKTNAKEMNSYMDFVYSIKVGEENIKKYLGGN